MKKVYIANISFNATEQDIRDLFSEYGEIESVKMITDKYTGQSRGFAFVEMESEDDAKKAHDDVQKTTDKHIKNVDEMLKHKEEEINEV